MIVYFLAASNWLTDTVRYGTLIGRVDFRTGITSSINKKGNRNRVFQVSMIAKSFWVREDLRAGFEATGSFRSHILELRTEYVGVEENFTIRLDLHLIP